MSALKLETAQRTTSVKIALLQINPTVGDLAGNARLIADAAREAARRGADLAVTPELALVGYLPRDLLLSAGFVATQLGRSSHDAGARARRVGRRRSSACPSRIPPTKDGRSSTRRRSLRGGRVEQRFRKALLPTYDVFDEDRYFEPFHGAQILELGGRRLGISICEDIWNDRDFWKRRRYHHDPVEELVARRRRGDRQPVGVAVLGRQAPPPRGDAGQHGAQARRAARLRQSVRRQRRPGLRRPELRVRRRRRADRPRPRVRRRRRHLRPRRRRRRSRRPPTSASSRRSGARSCSARATTRASAASRARCSACRAASTRR